jgi:hypothetical protein
MLTFVVSSFILQLAKPLSCVSYLLIAFGRLPNQVSLTLPTPPMRILAGVPVPAVPQYDLGDTPSLCLDGTRLTLYLDVLQVIVVAMVCMMTFFHMPKLDQPIITVTPALKPLAFWRILLCVSCVGP